ncbi:MAG: leucine-rich repeat protein, partial [Bacteroidales bacterium]|nr:leucine-rich repeat protein [Bacteroidales bacterium]
TDGNYYWTVKIGAADPVWMLDKDGNKIRTTGDNGKDAVSPQVRINSATNMWEISVDGGVSWVSTGVAATGATGAAGVSPQVRINSATNTWEISIDGGVSWTGTGVAATGATGAAGKDGKDGSSPVVSVKLFTDGNYYWTINGEWLIVDGNFVPATGPQGQRGATGPKGDAVFAANGINNTNADYVGFTLANGTKIQLPRYKPFKIGLDAGNDAITLSAVDTTLSLKLPSGFVESDYSSIMARMITKNTEDSDIKTKAGVGPAWEVTVNKPTFTAAGVCKDDAAVNIKPIIGRLAVGDNSMLEVSIIDADGGSITASRVITAGEIATFNSSTHTVNVITRGSLTSALVNDAVNTGNTLIINGLLSGEYTGNDIGTSDNITRDWNALRSYIRGRSANIDLTLNNVANVITHALSNCPNLASVSVPNAVSIEKWAFENCTQLITVDLPNAVSVGKAAFYKCGQLATVSLPKAVYIKQYSFSECSQLATISLPNVTSVGMSAFYSCTKLATVSLPNVTSIEDCVFCYCSNLKNADLPNATSVKYSAFENCTQLTTISLPKVTSVGNMAFKNCTALTTIDLPKVTSVGNWAFYGCTHLTTIDLPNVVSVNSLAFEECTQLTTVSLPKVTSVGNMAFQNCSALTTLKLAAAGAIDSFGDDVFLGVTTGSCDLYIGAAEIATAADLPNKKWRVRTWKSISQYNL